MLEASRRVRCSTTSTSGLSASIVTRADSVFGVADPLGVVDHLALQVGGVDDVVVDQPERADPRRGQVERGRRAEPAGADQQHLRVQHLQLALDADLGQQRVARVAVALLGGHPAGRDDRQPLLLPGEDAARHRGDVLVAERLHLLGRGVGAVAAAAVEDRPRRLVRRGGGDLVAEQARRHQLAALQMGLLVLVRLAGVDQDDVAALDLLRAPRTARSPRPAAWSAWSMLPSTRKSPKSDPALLHKV